MGALAIKERPILFSGEMVKAILAGRKTQTRRVFPVQPYCLDGVSRMPWPAGKKTRPIGYGEDGILGPTAERVERKMIAACPYGFVGDRLWVRETFYVAEVYSHGTCPSGEPIEYPGVPRGPVHYDADGPPANTPNRHYQNGLREGCGKYAAPDPYAIWIKRPTIHMPRWASRLTLEITGVRVERLQKITWQDADAEGVNPDLRPGFDIDIDGGLSNTGTQAFLDAYRELWERINGEDSWAANPWVWVVTFKRLEMPEVRS